MDGMIDGNTIFRTAHKYIENAFSGFGSGLPHGINQVCRCCKSSDTKELHGEELRPFNDFYSSGKNEFKAYKCNVCNYPFSWFRAK